MIRKEILNKIREFAKFNGYYVSNNAEKIAEAKRRMGKDWFYCPCQRDGKHFCGSDLCTKEIEKNSICYCGLFLKSPKK